MFNSSSTEIKNKNEIQCNLKNVQEAGLALINRRASDRLARIKIDFVFMRCRGYLSVRSFSALERRGVPRGAHREGGDERKKRERNLPSENSRDLTFVL